MTSTERQAREFVASVLERDTDFAKLTPAAQTEVIRELANEILRTIHSWDSGSYGFQPHDFK